MILEKNKVYYQAGLITILLSVYVYTLLPGIGYIGDTIRFQFLGRILGTPHPTGFPLYLILNHLFTRFFPIGSLAYKSNLLSAVFSVSASWVLFRIASDLFKAGNLVSFVSALTFGLTFTLWSQSLVAECYTLLVLFLALSCYFFILWRDTKNIRHFYIATAIYALSFGNHPLIITILPAVVYFVYATDKKLFISPRVIIIVLFFILLSMSQYLYFIWRFYDPSTKFLDIAPSNLKELWFFMSGGIFKANMFRFSITDVVFKKIPLFVCFFIREYHILIPFIIYGMILTARKKQWLNIFLILIIIVNIMYSIFSFSSELYTYVMISYFALSLYFCVGLNAVLSNSRFSGKALSRCIVVIPVIFFSINILFVSQRHNTKDDIMTQKIIKEIGNNALVVAPSFTVAQCLSYYLIGYGIGEKHNILSTDWVFPIEKIIPYIIEGKPIKFGVTTVSPAGFYAPAGLNVYLIDNFWYQNSYRIQNNFFEDPYYMFTNWKRVFWINKVFRKPPKFDTSTPGNIEYFKKVGLKVIEVKEGIYWITK